MHRQFYVGVFSTCILGCLASVLIYGTWLSSNCDELCQQKKLKSLVRSKAAFTLMAEVTPPINCDASPILS